MTIRSFRGDSAEPILRGGKIPKDYPADLVKVTRRKLVMLDAATTLADLKSPGNKLEPAPTMSDGSWCIRINDLFRLVFLWEAPDAHGVGVMNYHSSNPRGWRGARNRVRVR